MLSLHTSELTGESIKICLPQNCTGTRLFVREKENFSWIGKGNLSWKLILDLCYTSIAPYPIYKLVTITPPKTKEDFPFFELQGLRYHRGWAEHIILFSNNTKYVWVNVHCVFRAIRSFNKLQANWGENLQFNGDRLSLIEANRIFVSYC